MNPLVTEVLARQLKSLKRIYTVIVVIAGSLVLVTLLLGSPEGFAVDSGNRLIAEVAMGALAALLLGLAVPLSRRRLLDPARIRGANREQLNAWGLPGGVDLTVGRQAIYLTRYSAGCIIGWGLSVSVGLYGLVARMLGSARLVAALFLAASVFALLLLLPRGQQLIQELERF